MVVGGFHMLPLNQYLWSVAAKLVKEKGFSLLDINEQPHFIQDNSTLHLIKNVKRDYLYIRIIPIDYIWPNHLIQDIEDAKDRANQLASQLLGGRVKFLNLYIFQMAVQDEVHQVISEHSRFSAKKTELFNGYIDLENKKLGIPNDALEQINLTIEPFTYYFANPLQDNVQNILNDIKWIEKERNDKIRNIFNYGKPFLTYFFIAVNTVLFLLMTIKGGSTNTAVLIDFGAKEPFLIASGEYWRLITPVFLHIGFTHFALNNLALFFLGRLSEKIYGSVRFFIIYMMAGIIGNISSFIFVTDKIGAGASGAIFGLFGALLYFGLVYPDLFFRTMGKDVITIIAINLIFGFMVPIVDNSAHIGGLVSGFLAASLVRMPKQTVSKRGLQLIAVFSLIIAIAVTFWGVGYREIKGSPEIFFKGIDALERGQIDQAYLIFDHLVKAYPNNPLHHYNYGVIHLKKGQLDEAETDFENALSINMNFPEAHYNLAYIYIVQEDLDKAVFHLEQALEYAPDYQQARDILEQISGVRSQRSD